MTQTFTVSEVVKNSWEALKQQIWVLVGLYIGYMIISGIISALASPTSILMSLIVMVLSVAISSIFNLGYYKNIFQTLEGIEPQFSAYGQQASKFLTYFVASLIAGIAISVGLFLLVIPGIYIGLRLQFFGCFIVEENAGIMDSLKRSWDLTEGNVMQLFLLALAQLVIGIVGFILLGIGIFVAAPLILVTQCYVFRLLNNPLAVAEEVVQDVAEQI